MQQEFSYETQVCLLNKLQRLPFLHWLTTSSEIKKKIKKSYSNYLKISAIEAPPPAPSEFSVTILGMGMDIFWKNTKKLYYFNRKKLKLKKETIPLTALSDLF